MRFLTNQKPRQIYPPATSLNCTVVGFRRRVTGSDRLHWTRSSPAFRGASATIRLSDGLPSLGRIYF